MFNWCISSNYILIILLISLSLWTIAPNVINWLNQSSNLNGHLDTNLAGTGSNNGAITGIQLQQFPLFSSTNQAKSQLLIPITTQTD